MKGIRELCGVVMTSAFLFGGCIDQGDEVGQYEQETVGAGAAVTTLANVTIGDGEFQVKWNGYISKVKGPVSLVTQDITIAPGGHTGWHSHPGPVLVSVSSGALTFVYATSPCGGATYPAGTGFVDPGGDTVHIARNESDVPVTIRVQYILPTGAPWRIDAPAPAGLDACSP
jgi:hypothetical protein